MNKPFKTLIQSDSMSADLVAGRGHSPVWEIVILLSEESLGKKKKKPTKEMSAKILISNIKALQ